MEMQVNPEMALRACLNRLEQTFRRVEGELGEGLKEADPEEIDRIWQSRDPAS